MIANPAIPDPVSVSPPFTLNDLRVHSSITEEPSSTSALTFSGLALAVVLAIGVFIWLDPLRLFTPTEASPPAPAIAQSAEPARPIERLEVIAPQTPGPAAKSVVVPIAAAPVVQVPKTSPLVVRSRAASINPEARGNPMDKTNTTVLPAKSSKENAAPPVLLTKPEEKTDAPIALKLGDDTNNAPKPAATNVQTPVTE
jgi:hypothetical protein